MSEDHNPYNILEPDEVCLATWWAQATPGTTYWRCTVPARELPGQSIPFRWESLQERDGVPFLPEQRGPAIWQFLGDQVRSKVALGMRDIWGVPTYMEIDDNYLTRPPYTRHGRISNRQAWKDTVAEAGNAYSYEMHRRVTPLMDGILASTEYLADIYYEYNENIHVVPNSIDVDDWKYERAEPDGIFRIVYYGSPSHVTDCPLVTRALKWASKQKDVEVWTAGFENPSWSFEYQTVPWSTSLAEARSNLFKFDLGLAPLVGNKWSRGKSDIKCLEYSMAGVLPLMSEEEPYRPWFRDWPELVVKKDDWEEVIRHYCQNRDTVPRLAQETREWTIANRSIEHTIDLWKEALGV